MVNNFRFLQVLEWFWMALSHFSNEDMAKFVQFVTGSSVLPPGGWSELSPKFQIGFSGMKFVFKFLCILLTHYA